MRTILLLPVFLFPWLVYAQHGSAGLFTGADYWMHQKSFYQASKHNWSVSEGLFARWDGKHRWSYEAAFQHSSEFREHSGYYTFVVDGWPQMGNVYITNDFGTRVYALALKADCRLNRRQDGRLQQYVGIQFRPTLWQMSMREVWSDSATRKTISTLWDRKDTYKRLWAGVQYTVCYRIRGSLSVRAVLAYEADPGDLFNPQGPDDMYHDPYGKASVNIGLLYKLR